MKVDGINCLPLFTQTMLPSSADEQVNCDWRTNSIFFVFVSGVNRTLWRNLSYHCPCCAHSGKQKKMSAFRTIRQAFIQLVHSFLKYCRVCELCFPNFIKSLHVQHVVASPIFFLGNVYYLGKTPQHFNNCSGILWSDFFLSFFLIACWDYKFKLHTYIMAFFGNRA